MNTAAPYVVGIGGGTGAGKTTLALALSGLLGCETATVVEADLYYRDLSHMPLPDRHCVNFDHPDALEVELLVEHLHSLRCGYTVRPHAYDFTTHSRTKDTFTLVPRPIILVEGIFVLACQPLLRLFDLKVYIDEDPAVRRRRRIQRDVRERGRTIEMSSRQYENHVLPMHERYVEPGKSNADIILHTSAETALLLPLLQKAAQQAINVTRHRSATS
jgi:uridine kinase